MIIAKSAVPLRVFRRLEHKLKGLLPILEGVFSLGMITAMNYTGGESNLPSDAILEQKKILVDELSTKLKESIAGVLVDYKGINVENDTKLRRELREAGVDYFVAKNTMLLRAAKDAGLDALESVLEGPTAIAVSKDDAICAAKILQKYADSTKGKFSVKAGFVEGKVLDAAEVGSLAKLPGREELVAMTLRGLNAPITGFVNVLNGNIRGLVVALGKIAEQAAEQSA